jgi:hypothetical protein
MTDDVQSSHVGPRYSVEPGTICAACGSDGVTFDNVVTGPRLSVHHE